VHRPSSAAIAGEAVDRRPGPEACYTSTPRFAIALA
jgi:hypothetical protein